MHKVLEGNQAFELSCASAGETRKGDSLTEVRALTVNENGAIGVFVQFHPSESEQGLLLYSESLPGSTDPDDSRQMMFRLKSSAGRKR
ncbi:MAG: hypothetical protein ACLQVM_18605 [Terriglobia bacterium]